MLPVSLDHAKLNSKAMVGKAQEMNKYGRVSVTPSLMDSCIVVYLLILLTIHKWIQSICKDLA